MILGVSFFNLRYVELRFQGLAFPWEQEDSLDALRHHFMQLHFLFIVLLVSARFYFRNDVGFFEDPADLEHHFSECHVEPSFRGAVFEFS